MQDLVSYITTQQCFSFMQLTNFIIIIFQAFDNGMLSCIVFFDVSKVFDRVWHKCLLFKLRQNDIEGKL